MNHCYYCGLQSHLVCDYIGKETEWKRCDRNICKEHAVPEFADGDIEQYTLCKDHAKFQHLAGETIKAYFDRIGKLTQ